MIKKYSPILILLTILFISNCSSNPNESNINEENISEPMNSELKISVSFYEAIDYKNGNELLLKIDEDNAEKIKYDYLANDSAKASWQTKQHPLTSKMLLCVPPGIAGTGTNQSSSVFLGSVLVKDTTIINNFLRDTKYKDIRPFWKVEGSSATLALVKAKSKTFNENPLSEIAFDDFSVNGYSQLIAKNDSSTTEILKSYFGPKSFLITKINFNDNREFILETSYKIFNYSKSFGMANINTQTLKALNEKYKDFVKPHIQEF
ncbi:MAG: hypothetical protein IPL10_12645 [Bacteroidetes bacterium]|nr:hypothetical protein [Bacteroidota bacterium]